MCANVRHVLVYSVCTCSCSWTVVYGGSANLRGHIRGRATLPVQLPLFAHVSEYRGETKV